MQNESVHPLGRSRRAGGGGKKVREREDEGEGGRERGREGV